MPTTKTIKINRAPVLTLWAAVVAERLGHDPDSALTLGKSVAGLNAQSKGRRLGLYEKSKDKEDKTESAKPVNKKALVEVLGRKVPTVETPEGVRATSKGQPIQSSSVRRYLERAFGSHLPAVQKAFEELARSYPPKQLAERAYPLYEEFRPTVPEGVKGWGAKGELRLDSVRALRRKKSA